MVTDIVTARAGDRMYRVPTMQNVWFQLSYRIKKEDTV